ncbi:hypothetical protein VNO80_02219 [Phaseolus coccineus]|uniref:Uncharacterized protein n=1 Tax=Phaseolus coccineus TaxID=3886 RepID=A0AAN9RMQ2_PHACN
MRWENGYFSAPYTDHQHLGLRLPPNHQRKERPTNVHLCYSCNLLAPTRIISSLFFLSPLITHQTFILLPSILFIFQSAYYNFP